MEHLFFFLLQDVPAKLFFISNFFKLTKLYTRSSFTRNQTGPANTHRSFAVIRRKAGGCVSMHLSQRSVRHRDEKISVKVFKWLTLRTNKNKERRKERIKVDYEICD